MISIKKSRVNEYALVKALDVHKATLKDWQDHMRRVDSDALNAKVKPIDKHVAYPRPVADPLVELIMKNGGTYTIEDDTPPPIVPPRPPTAEELLPTQKLDLMAQLNATHVAAINKIASPAKQALYVQKVKNIYQSDMDKSTSFFKKLVGTIIPSFNVENNRSSEDNKFLEEYKTRNDQLQALQLKAMQAQSDIEDLTVTTIQSWKNPEFS